MTQTTSDVVFLLLVGGKSSRMGEDKAFLPIGKNSTFIKTLAKKISIFKFNLFLSLRKEQLPLYESWFPNNSFIFDQFENIQGPLCGLISAHHFLKSNHIHYKAIFTIAVDTPSIKLKSIKRLIDRYHENPNLSGVFYQTKNGIEPLCAIYNKSTLEEWIQAYYLNPKIELSLQKKIKALENTSIFLNLPMEEEIFLQNINSKSDFELYHR
ncbi:molybdenum cofactor guanylyltransferase [Leptospira paudalimensis]|uniref:NTP transferase domain-containing protein n=1 Tax=Leptospira paudalimensis TaxID=2950024 RepID=A0ABT3M3P8_9LEPT|nr:NTP transferase domain-containing protein [Leptospira paudalimensis]MCW7503015.1 NTP transferase domain-containing protein [Leptospira paudalimensis]